MDKYAKECLDKANTFLKNYGKEITIKGNSDNTYCASINGMLMFNSITEDRLQLNIMVLFFSALVLQK